MVNWIELDKWLRWLGIHRSDVWANLLFVKGNSTEGGEKEVKEEKNAANVDLAWHFYACCEPCVAPASTGDSEWWPDWKCSRQQRKSDMQAKHCGGHFYPPARANRSDLLCFSHLLQQTLCWVMAWQNTAKGSHFSPPVLSGWKEATARKLRFLRPCCCQLLCLNNECTPVLPVKSVLR